MLFCLAGCNDSARIGPNPILRGLPEDNFHGITLSASITADSRHISSLALSLRNANAKQVSLETGVIVSRSYPAANFSYQLQLPDGRVFEVFCELCSPAGVAGMSRPYKVSLPAGGVFRATIALQDLFYIDSGDRRMCMPAARGATLTVSFPSGRYTSGTLARSLRLTCSKRDNEAALEWELRHNREIVEAIRSENRTANRSGKK